MKNTIRGNQKTQPNKKNRIPSNKSLSTDKHTPACSKKMPLGLPCTKNDDVNRSMHQNFNSHICRDKNLCLIHKVPLSRHYIHCMLNCSSVTYILSNTVIIPCRHNQTKTGQARSGINQVDHPRLVQTDFNWTYWQPHNLTGLSPLGRLPRGPPISKGHD